MDISRIQSIPVSKNAGFVLRGLLNGVKQTAESFAAVHGLDAGYLEAVMNGSQPLTPEIIMAVDAHSPLNARRLFDPQYRNMFPIVDDTEGGVVVCTADMREKTKRTFHRGPNGGEKIPYYDYADTAMSRLSAFRPEWIAERFVHNGVDTALEDWAFNKGHFEHQMTYFIGPVNFHWIDKAGTKHVRQMNTGDTNFITPFVPHSFTTRQSGTGLILAVTYGGAIATDDFQLRIQSLSLDDYLSRYEESVKRTLVDSAVTTAELGGVIIRGYNNAAVIENDAYMVKELMSNVPYQQHTRAYEYTVKHSKDSTALDENVDADLWGYNVGDTPVFLVGKGGERELEPGSSFFIRPNTPHAFRCKGEETGKLACMQIKPGVGSPLEELALIYAYAGWEGLKRVHSETKQWF